MVDLLKSGLELRTKHEYIENTFSPFGCAGAKAPAAGGDVLAGGDGLDGGTAEMRRTRTIANGDEPVLALGGDADIC